jgi:hypothetical protein
MNVHLGRRVSWFMYKLLINITSGGATFAINSKPFFIAYQRYANSKLRASDMWKRLEKGLDYGYIKFDFSCSFIFLTILHHEFILKSTITSGWNLKQAKSVAVVRKTTHFLALDLWTKSGFEPVTVTQSATSKWSLGSIDNFENSKQSALSEWGNKDLVINTNILHCLTIAICRRRSSFGLQESTEYSHSPTTGSWVARRKKKQKMGWAFDSFFFSQTHMARKLFLQFFVITRIMASLAPFTL